MALSALADDGAGARWARVFQHRFRGNGALAGHAVGNLLLAGLVEVLGDPVAALDEACRLLGVRGRVLPMCTEPLDIEAEVSGLNGEPEVVRRIRGQVAVATTPGRVHRVRLLPERPVACEQAVRAVLDADLIVLGPGSWFTSVLPHLLVPALHAALTQASGMRVLVLNLVPQPGETAGFSPEQHLHVLSSHAPGLVVDAVLADIDAVTLPGRLTGAAGALGAKAHLARLAAAGARDRHDPVALAALLDQVLARDITAVTGVSAASHAGSRQPRGRPPAGREERAVWQ
jgi:uncharacterized cofD-like protein